MVKIVGEETGQVAIHHIKVFCPFMINGCGFYTNVYKLGLHFPSLWPSLWPSVYPKSRVCRDMLRSKDTQNAFNHSVVYTI